MRIIGLCGGSGSGKGAVAGILVGLGVPVIDTDAVYHNLTVSDSECLRELVSYFGEEILSDNGSLHRPTLARIVFADGAAEKRARLNHIAHKHVLSSVRESLSTLRERGYALAAVDAPLLYESGFDKECDDVIAVIADRDTRINRIMSRDAITRDQAIVRIDSQISDTVLCERADYVIENNATLIELEASVKSIINDLRSK